MSYKSLRRTGIAGLILGIASVVGCGGGEPLPPTGGAGYPGHRGPATPADMPKKGAVGKGRSIAGASKATPTPPAKAGQKPGP
jgi:hypothetical protein